jgi:transcriptional regulator GlxA family with amidase domain
MRTLHRRLRAQMGITPAKLLETLRVEHARTLLSTSAMPAKTIAVQSGFATAARMKRAFARVLGVGPRDYRLLFAGR